MRKSFTTTLEEDVVKKIRIKVLNSNKFNAMNDIIEFLADNFLDLIDDDGNILIEEIKTNKKANK